LLYNAVESLVFVPLCEEISPNDYVKEEYPHRNRYVTAINLPTVRTIADRLSLAA